MFAALAPYKLLFECLAFLALIAGIAFGIHKFLQYEQNIGYQKAVAEYTEKQLVAEQAARKVEEGLRKQLEDARNDATKREQTIKTLSATSVVVSNGLRDVTNNIRNGLPTASLDAARKSADTFGALLVDCQGKYRVMAEIADRHASDVKTLMDSWPKNPAQ